ncbi:MAG: hypothetical protein JWN27_3493 [Candidatus Eremiobacteraeota bacterium]|nr:hypothetical protein [Candidatus Eremiobacteraeota bacterium]
MIVDRELIARAVGPDRYERARRIAWATAARSGNALSLSASEREDHRGLYDIVEDVLGAAFVGADSSAAMMSTACSLYEDFPSYTILSQIFFTIEYETLSDDEKREFYRFLGTMLSAAAIELARPAGYMLWVDHFEDESRVDDAWHTVCAAITSDDGWRRLLEASGPVPERLKLPVLERFIAVPSFQDAVFNALAAAVFDVYGQIDRATVEAMLPRLQIDRSAPAYTDLLVRLADPAPIELGWSLKED